MKRELKTELTKQKIINAAMVEFSKKGYEKGSVNEICKSGINKGLIYHNYQNKDEIYLICVKKSCDSFLELIDQNLADVDLGQYLECRQQYLLRPESRIFYEAFLNPPPHLAQEIRVILHPFYQQRDKTLKAVLSRSPLRDGWTQEEAYRYFYIIIDSYNEFFAKKRMRSSEIAAGVEEHETDVQKLIDLLLYGVVRRENS